MTAWLELKDTLALAEKRKQNPLEIEKEHLARNVIPLHYQRNYTAISLSDQIKLLDSRVGVCGCGGLGMNVVNYLARLGVGHITVWDPDIFSENNLNRQLFSCYDNLGKSKVEVCRNFIQKINPAVCLTAIPAKWEESDASVIGRQQVMVDALDNIPSRLALASTCEKFNIPLVHAAVGGWYGQLTVVMPGDQILQEIYQNAEQQQGIEKEQGTLPFTAAVLACLEAAETVKLLLDMESDLRSNLCLVDLLNMSLDMLPKCNLDVNQM
ncbi:MAG TPA: HesA/MoeB/ThiF family protein [Syntrophomonadaceae bacterium]|nr:HesA/MoeB/ThiF family protein [Syntrophomonadaceae bacterium]HOQ08993.1 HesA/MoeB/ThiF family protein [Syntrophomonadaceae bacterium]HPU47916.1 HesA/MoeB/ThiF family protein [Syntrophomonadaceae bacterium]